MTLSVGIPKTRGGADRPMPIPLTVLMPMRTPVKLPGPVVTASAVRSAGCISSVASKSVAESVEKLLGLAPSGFPGDLGQQSMAGQVVRLPGEAVVVAVSNAKSTIGFLLWVPENSSI